MFLLKSIDLVAPVSPIVQALVAWVFFAIQRTLTRREGAARAVFVTGDLAAPESVQFVERCRWPVLPKPFEFDELFRALERTARPARVGQPGFLTRIAARA